MDALLFGALHTREKDEVDFDEIVPLLRLKRAAGSRRRSSSCIQAIPGSSD